MPVTLIHSSWSSGSLIFHESTSVAPSTTYNVFSIGTGAVKVGDTANDVDFQWYGTGSKSFILDLGAATMTLVGLATSTDGAVTITDATESTSTTTGALIVSGGIGFAKDMYVGDDVFLTSAAKLDWAAGNVTLTHSTGTLTNSGILVNTGAISVDDTTESTSTTTGSLHTDGGLGVAKDIYAGDDLFFASGGVINFNAGNITLTHAAGSLTMAGGELVINGAATATDHPINLNSITAVTDDETTDFGNILKVSRSAGAVGGTHSAIIAKNYITGGAVDGTALVSGLYVNLRYEPTSENAAAEVSLMETHLYSSASDAIDYGWYCLAPASKISALLGVSGTMTNFLEVKASGDAGMTVSADGMTGDPENDTEAGYITIKVEGGTSYQIPFYTA